MDQNLNITIKMICKHLCDSPQVEIFSQNSNYRDPSRDLKVKELIFLYICSFLSLASTLIDRRQLLLKANYRKRMMIVGRGCVGTGSLSSLRPIIVGMQYYHINKNSNLPLFISSIAYCQILLMVF